MSSDRREELAALEHDQWAHWTKYMLEVLRPVLRLGFYEARDSGTGDKPFVVKARKSLRRWTRQIETPYEALSESEKDSDRAWADRVLEHFGFDSKDAVEGAVNTFDADRVAYLKAELRKYNEMDLRTANVVRGGKSVSIPEQVMREWEFVGLNNTDLIDFWDFNSAELLRESSIAELDGLDFKDAVEEAYSFSPPREEPDSIRDRKLVSQPSASDLLMKVADIIDEQLAMDAQSPGESHIGPGAVSAAIRTAIKICKKEA